ncbi:MAG TPA: hypothetical protein VJK90_03040 [Acetobacteraceae bacterium]|nr:hypothetical protein [Acetobacteraceae bacterium]
MPTVDHGAQGVPDIPVEHFSGGRYPGDMEARIAVLEQIARTTATALERMDGRMDRIDQRLDMLWGAQRGDFKWLLGMMVAGTGTILASILGLLGVMAHGFHWL